MTELPNIVVTETEVIVDGVPVPGIIGEDVEIIRPTRQDIGQVRLTLFYSKLTCEESADRRAAFVAVPKSS